TPAGRQRTLTPPMTISSEHASGAPAVPAGAPLGAEGLASWPCDSGIASPTGVPVSTPDAGTLHTACVPLFPAPSSLRRCVVLDQGVDGGGKGSEDAQDGVGHMTVDTCGKPYLPTLHTAFKAHRMSAEVPRSSKESWCPNMAILLE